MEILKSNIEVCSACGSSNLKLAIRMEKLPHVGVYVENKADEKNFPFVDNNLNVCMDCGHGQLTYALDPNFLYNTNFQHCTSCSMSAKQANDWLYEFITTNTKKQFDVVAEIGINDSYFLKKFATTAKKVIGVDPILKNNEKKLIDGVPEDLKKKFVVVGDFIENVDFLDYADQKPDLYMSNFVFEHIKEPKSVIENILNNCKDNAIIVIGVPGSEFLYENSRFDQLSHQHYQQFTKHSLRLCVERAGGEVIKIDTNFPNWGQIAIAFKKRTKGFKEYKTNIELPPQVIFDSYNNFTNHIEILKRRFKVLEKKEMFGFGAAQNFPVFASFYKEKLPFDLILDDNPQRQNQIYPNLPYNISKPMKDGSYFGKVGIMTGPDYARVLMGRMSKLGFDHIVVPFNSY